MSTGQWRSPKKCNRCGSSFPRTREFFSGKGLKQGYCRACADAALAASQLVNPKLPPHESGRWLAKKRAILRERAARKGVPFVVSPEFIKQKFALTHCEATGVAFEPSGPFSKSLDRIDPQLGYVESNLRMVAYIHNAARGAWGDEALAKYVAALAKRKNNLH